MNKQISETDIPEIIDSKKLIKWLFRIFIVASLFTIIVFLLYFCNFNGWYEFSNNQSISNADWGTFGDFIGGTLNPILSFLSLIALLLTIILQNQELEQTRKELIRSASAQEETKNILDKQSETLARQQFESTFFSLLDQHNKALEDLTSSEKRISKLSEIMTFIFFEKKAKHLDSAKVYLEEKNHLCGHYFRVLYQLLKFIATNSPNSNIGQMFEADKIQNEKLSNDEKMYSNIVRAFLGYEITQLLSINCYCKNSTDTYWRYKLLIERYEFLEHMPFKHGINEEQVLLETQSFYKSSAFGNSNFVSSQPSA